MFTKHKNKNKNGLSQIKESHKQAQFLFHFFLFRMSNVLQQIELEQTCVLHNSSLSQVLPLVIMYWPKIDGNEGIFIACMCLPKDRPIFYLPLWFEEEHKEHTMVLWRTQEANIKTQTQEKMNVLKTDEILYSLPTKLVRLELDQIRLNEI